MLSVYGERTAPALVRERDEFSQLLDVCPTVVVVVVAARRFIF
jgi:hypothetical protein